MFDRITTTIMGNLVSEPVARVVPGTGEELVGFRVAVDNGYWDRDQKKEVKTGTTFLPVTCKGKLGENVIASNYPVGTRLIIPGELTNKEYERKDGSKGTDTKLKAIDVGPSNMWTEVRVPPKDARQGGTLGNHGGGKSAPPLAAGGYGSPMDYDPYGQPPQEDPWRQY